MLLLPQVCQTTIQKIVSIVCDFALAVLSMQALINIMNDRRLIGENDIDTIICLQEQIIQLVNRININVKHFE